MTSTTSQERSKSLWSARWALRRVILVMFTAFGVGFVYYGVQINVDNLNFNLYVSTVVNAVTEVPAVFVGSILLNIIPRRVLFSFSTFVAAVATMLCVLFSAKKSKSSWPQLSLEAVGFVGAAMAYGTLYIYSAELFPTNVRNFALSMMRLSLMLGATIAPLMVALGPSVSFLVFGGLALVSGMVVFWLPETKDAPLYETLEEQEEEEKLGARGSVSAEVELAI